MGLSVTVVYQGGEVETIPIRPLGLVAAERQFGGGASNGHSIEATFWAAWYLKGKPNGSFDDWLATIEDVTEKREDPSPPLAEAPSAEQSQT